MPSFPTSHHSVPGKSSQRHSCLLTSLSTEFLTRLLFYLQEALFEEEPEPLLWDRPRKPKLKDNVDCMAENSFCERR